MITLGPAFISGIGGGEVMVIFIIFLMLFGAKKLPGIARSLGKSMAEFQRAAREVREEFLNADREVNTSSTPAPPAELPSGGSTEDGPDHDPYPVDAAAYETAGESTGDVSSAADGASEAPAAVPVADDAPIVPVREADVSEATGSGDATPQDSPAESPAPAGAEPLPEKPADGIQPAAAVTASENGEIPKT